MQCADFKVRLRLWPATFFQAKWMEHLPKDYAAYLNFYQLANNKHQSGMAKARAGWVILNQERLWTQAFQPTGCVNESAKGTLVHLHGYYDHGASYPSLQRWALKNKLYYLTIDLLGHGLSSGERASINSFTDYQKILTALIEILTINNMPKPWLLSGFSTGGAIALEHQLTVNKFDATVLFAPLIRPVAWQTKLAKWLWLPRLFIKNLPRKFTVNSNDTAFLKFVQQQDCLQSKQLPLAWIIALGRWIKQIESTKPNSVEALIIQGDADSTVDWQYNLGVLHKLLPQAVTKIIKEGAHQLLNDGEAQRLQVFDCLDQWLVNINKREKNE
ncbi:MAG TPA: alpha/beta hydrolase [Marinospirillum sp.]|uniref:alpha/beta hydrolase n=1 Tax=Marinospirillum sp. TaxID=2183934 RepID=UPI002B48878B|nr:alpha/beta hydrolase [Marinospirillum sp.]HKM15919.1 alpha/beta hydrolase [Marinospirillum sp.]